MEQLILFLHLVLKLPVFWPDAAEVWFAQADSHFAIRAVSVSKTKFYHAAASLPQDVAAHILDLIRAPPAGKPYKVLKDRLTTLYSLNNYQRFVALVSLPLTGNQKPSHLMLALLPDDYKPNFILRGLFLCCLPIKVHSHLLKEKISDPCSLALKADKLFQSRISSPVNLLAGQLEDVQLKAVATRTRPSPPSKQSPTPASTSPAGGASFPTCWFLQDESRT